MENSRFGQVIHMRINKTYIIATLEKKSQSSNSETSEGGTIILSDLDEFDNHYFLISKIPYTSSFNTKQEDNIRQSKFHIKIAMFYLTFKIQSPQ